MATRFTSLCPVKGSSTSSCSPSTLEPAHRQPLSFSINKILGLEEEGKLHCSSSDFVRSEPLLLSPTLQSDVTVSSSDCDSESDQQPIRSEKPSKKRRQRTTFSGQEVWAMERAYKRCRYLTVEDEVDLVKRFRIPVRSIKFWFQNRRAKSQREKRYGLECSTFLRAPVQCFTTASLNPHFNWDSYPSTRLNRFGQLREHEPRENLIVETRNYRPSSENQPESHSLGLLLPHPELLKYRLPSENSKRQYSRVSDRFQPY
ncbi:paired mesoderm homeobox protein 1-like [Acropora millepora]|uniref:paired mesoderm homeobox protein 1-like n=1 Tax=Acropora millepora TaxID=45264 RepID=UPI001CF4BF49|nr:paired mesoderm homeobox protein 1-like [Acropora millepora]